MLGLLSLCLALLEAQDPPGAADAPRPLARSALTPAEAEALAEYNAMMASPPKDAAGHWKLGLWCEGKGLRPEAYFHIGKVIELDPKKDAAWLKLGFKKVDGRWLTAEQAAAEAVQKKADKEWSARLKKWHKDVHEGRKKAEVLAALEKVSDPAAVPSIYREFCGGGGADQEIALSLLGRIDGPIASKVIATLAVYGKTPSARRHATELLRGRPPEEFLDLLVALMQDLMKYEVRPVGGPGSPGILFVEGERFNVRRFYAPPPVATFNPRPGDSIGYDANGFPIVSRTNFGVLLAGPKVGVPGSKTLVSERDLIRGETTTYSYAAAMVEAQRAALGAQAQLASDIATIDGLNETNRKFNELVSGVARAATGKDPGPTAKDWRDLLAKGKEARYARRTPDPASKPTVDEAVPLAYLPDLSAYLTFKSQTFFMTQVIADS